MVVCTLVLASGLLAPVAAAQEICRFHCGLEQQTAPVGGLGVTCDEAEQNGIALAAALIPCGDTCFKEPFRVNTPYCIDKDGMKRIDIAYRYRCLIEICRPGPITPAVP